jgi:transcriptional regulator with XRE-family HTH domain
MSTTTKSKPLIAHVILEAQEPNTGRFDGLKLGAALGLSVAEMAQYLGVSDSALRKTPNSSNYQKKFMQLSVVAQRLKRLLDNSLEYTRIWLRAPHPDLDYQAPMDCILEGDIASVSDLIEMFERGQTA